MAANARCRYGALLTQVGRFEEAEDHLLSGYEPLRSELGDEHDRTHSALDRVLELFTAWGKPEKAAAYQRRISESP